MATASLKFSQKSTPNHHCNIPLRGQVAPHSKAKLVIETLKYLLFQRQQIPLPFERLKYEQQQKLQVEQLSTGNENDKVPRTRKPQSLEQKRWAALVQATEELIENINNLFCVCQISHILVIFGATIISPKEVHHIVFTETTEGGSSDSSEEERLSTKHCQRQFMKAMITNNSLIDAKALTLTSTHFMVYAHRQSGLSWFKPRATFKMPVRGQHYTFEVQCGNQGVQSRGTQIQNSCGSESETSNPDLSSENSSDSVEDATSCLSDLTMEDTHMWFEAPLVIKGVKDKSSRKASSSDIWM